LTAVKHVVKAAKTKSWEEFGEFMEEYSRDNQALFYKILKNMRRGKDCPLKYIKDKEGKLLIGEKEIMNRWRKYFQELLECEEKEQAETEVHQNTEETRLVISLEELKTAIRKMKLGKAAGHNQITPEMVKYIGLEGEKLLLRVVHRVIGNAQSSYRFSRKATIGNVRTIVAHHYSVYRVRCIHGYWRLD
jgi:hypothetical protein